MITSTSNSQVKNVRALQSQARYRRAQGAFVVEGVRMAEEAAASGWSCRLVFYTADLDERGAALLPVFHAAGAHLEEVAPHVMKAASDTHAPQGLLAVIELQEKPLPQPLDLVLILDQMRDPGNLGTILRTAAAAGVQAVFIPPGSADTYAPKVIRAAMGGHFRLVIKNMDWEQIGLTCQQHGLQVLLAAAAGDSAYTELDLKVPLALVIGSEAHGAGPQASLLASYRVSIPLPGKMESLNAAAAAAILLFEALRQRNET